VRGCNHGRVDLRPSRSELAALVLVALTALPVVSVGTTQDATRYEQTRHLVLYHTLTVGPGLFDRAVRGGRTYSDKAPGMSFLAVPAYQAERALGVARAPRAWDLEGDRSLWGIRLATSGLLFLLCAWLVGRAAETLVPRTGAATLATFGVATLAAPLAATMFEHDAAAFWAFGGFLAAWETRSPRRLALAGALLGVGVLFSYLDAIPAVIVAGYVLLRARQRVGWLLLGALPAALALAAYDWAAFGSPFHLSYRYVANRYAASQHAGFFGIEVPGLHGLYETLVGSRGLLVFSPVLVAAAAGLWPMWRAGRRAETVVAVLVSAAFLLVSAGYFLPYGGVSPGPRFFVPALPFLLLGLPYALRRAPLATLALALVSAGLTTFQSVTWALRKEGGGVVPEHPIGVLAKTIWVFAGLDRIDGAMLVSAAAAGAVAVGAAALLRSGAPRPAAGDATMGA
jgi:hypothetical protein